jgi:amino acid permease
MNLINQNYRMNQDKKILRYLGLLSFVILGFQLMISNKILSFQYDSYFGAISLLVLVILMGLIFYRQRNHLNSGKK